MKTTHINQNDFTKGMLIFRRLGISTLVIVYLLILVGGIVRSTGSGMGCPDWPKCFGEWVPPTEVSQLPDNYKDVYAQQRKEKNERLAKMLSAMGFKDLGERIKGDKSTYEEEDFNVYKTWIEYLNRLLGVLAGFFVLFTLVASFAFWKKDRLIVYLSIFSLVLTGFQGWIGSIVVSTNLLPGMITVHMLLAILLVFCLIYVVHRSYQGTIKVEQIQRKQILRYTLWAGIALLTVQLMLGTQVREAIDLIAKALGEAERWNWISNLGVEFYIHRSFSWLVILVHIFLVYLLFQNTRGSKGLVYKGGVILLGFMVLETVLGAGMAYFAIPAFIQPIHLVLAVIGLGIQYFVLLLINQNQVVNTTQDFNNEILKADDYNQVSY